MTNMTNLRTCSTGSMDMIFSGVYVLHGQLVQLVGNMICSTGINIPISIYPIRCGSSSKALIQHKIFIKSVPALRCQMVFLEVDLAGNIKLRSAVVVVVARTTPNSTSVAATSRRGAPPRWPEGPPRAGPCPLIGPPLLRHDPRRLAALAEPC
jgi:hypothetical protein